MLEQLKEEYANQDNRCTAYPIYVTVQKQICVGVIADGYSVNCPHGDGETRVEYYHEIFEDSHCDTLEEAQQALIEYYGEDATKEFKNIKELNCGYVWTDVEMFLTIKGAEAYMKANSHNLGKCRTYVKWFETRNHEMRGLLKEIGFKVKD